MRNFLIGALVIVLHQQFAAAQVDGIGIECPPSKTADTTGTIVISNPRVALAIRAINPDEVTRIMYKYNDANGMERVEILPLPPSPQTTMHTLTGFMIGRTVVTVDITDGTERALCTFRGDRVGIPAVNCPVVATSTQSQISFTTPSLTNFPNNGANAFYSYSVTNLDVNPPVMNVNLGTASGREQTHVLSNLQLGNNQIMVMVTDTTTNPQTTAACNFNYFRTGIICPNPSSSTSTSISFDRPPTTLPGTGQIMYSYTRNGMNIGTFFYNPNNPNFGTTHSLSGFSSGSNTITVTATDNLGNVVTCTFTYIVTTILSLQCPPNVVSNVACGQGSSFINFNPANPSNLLGASSITYNANTNTPVSFNTQNPSQVTASFPVGTWIVTAMITDSGRPFGQNTATCQFQVNIAAGDTVPPQVTCPADLSSQVQCGTASGQLNFQRPTGSDNAGTPSVQCTAGGVQLSPQGNSYNGNFPPGVTTITCTATDTCGLTGQCQFRATVSSGDATPPTVQCPANLNSQAQCGAASGQLTFQRPTGNDNTGIPSVQCSATGVQLQPQGNQYSATFPSGTTTITCIATDACGLTARCSFSAVVSGGDATPPQITCPANLNSQAQCGTASGQLNFQRPSGSDNAGTPSVQCTAGGVQLFPQGNIYNGNFPPGVTTITCTATDTCGLTAQCRFSATVSSGDSIPPQITCPANLNSQAQCGTASGQLNFQRPSGSDNAGSPSVQCTAGGVQLSPQGNGYNGNFPPGVTTISCTATDTCGLSAMCQFTATVSSGDSTPPSVTCPANLNSQAQCGTASGQLNFQRPSGSDNAGSPSVQCTAGGVQLSPQGNGYNGNFPPGATTITCTATDTCGLTGQCQFTATVSSGDATPPQITCPANLNSQAQCGTASGQLNFQRPSGSDNAGTPSVQCTAGGVQLFPQGNIYNGNFPPGVTTITCTATDTCGLTAQCRFSATVSSGDSIPPQITCPANLNSQAQCGTASGQLNFQRPSGSDNAGSPSVQCTAGGVQLSPQGNGYNGNFPPGVTTISCTATDTCGLSAMCQFTATVSSGDSTPPQVACPANLNSQVQCGTASGQLDFQRPSGSDNVGSPSVQCSAGGVQLSPQGNRYTGNFPPGVTTITCTATDTCGLSAMCQFTASVSSGDTDPPRVTCPANLNSQAQCGTASGQLNFQRPSGSDNAGSPSVQCTAGGVQLTPQGNGYNGNFPQGVTTITCTATDTCGLTAQCQFTATVQSGDSTPPQVTCPANLNSQAQCGTASGQLNFQRPSGSDNTGSASVQCTAGGVQLSPQGNGYSGNFPSGVTTITCTATDTCGLTGQCQFTATVSSGDSTPPQVTCPANLNSQAQCGTASGQLNFQRPSGNDNAGTPSVQCAAGGVQLSPQGNGYNGNFPPGVTTITCTATDTCGLTGQCQFTATVSSGDSTPPQVTCPANLNSQAQCGTASGQLNFQRPSGNDNAGTPSVQCAAGGVQLSPQGNGYNGNFPPGVTTITCTATDTCGLTAQCQFTATVSSGDSTPPQVTCPANLNSQAQCGTASGQLNFQRPSGSDNAGSPSVQCTAGGVQLSPQGNGYSGNFPPGVTTITCTATDTCGLTGQCQFTATVSSGDTSPPQVTCPANLNSQVQCGTASGQLNFQRPSGSDNVGSPSVQCTAGGVQLSPQGNGYNGNFPPGVTTITCTATDTCGLTAQCQFTATVSSGDTMPPQVTCPANLNSQAQCGTASGQLSFQRPSGSDNAGNPSVQCSAGGVQLSPQGNSYSGNFPPGVTTITCTASDTCGLTAQCQFTATVSSGDTTPPQVACPANLNSQAQCGTASGQLNFQRPSGSDNVGSPSVQCTAGGVQLSPQGNGYNGNFPPGVTTITCTATDTCGLTAQCQFTATVSSGDATPPQVTCPANLNSQAQCGTASGQLNFQRPSGSDNAGTPSVQCTSGGVQLSPQGNGYSGNFPPGVTTITCTATDTCGLTGQCQFSATVSSGDTIPPQVNCPANLNSQVQCGTASGQLNFQRPSGSDNVGSPSVQCTAGGVQLSPQGNGYNGNFPSGVTTITCTATDTCGLTGQCQFTATVSSGDTMPPQVTCPANLNSQAQCGTASGQLNFQRPSGSDNAGSPSVQCTAGGVQLTPQGNGYSGNFPPGVTTITCTATDTCGLTGQCQFTATVSSGDETPPQVTCPANLNSQVQCGTASGQLNFQRPSGSDNVGTPSVQCSAGGVQLSPQGNSYSGNFPMGVTTITCTAADTCGLTAQCQFTATVSSGDTTPPQVTCPANLNSQAQCGTASGQLNFQRPSGSDNAGTPSVQCSAGGVQLSPQGNGYSGSFPPGVTTITCTASDTCGLTGQCQFTATVSSGDTMPPQVTCPANLNSQAQCGTASGQLTFQRPSGSDNAGTPSVQCSAGGVQLSPQGNGYNGSFPPGVTTITCMATDTCGLTAQCQFSATVSSGDSTPPQVTCPANLNSQVQCGTASGQLNFQRPSGSDNVGTPSVQCTAGGVQLSPQGNGYNGNFPPGVTTISCTATDSCGLTGQCQFTATVSSGDSTPPQITCPSNLNSQVQCGTASGQLNFQRPSGSDNAGSPTVQCSAGGVQLTPQGNSYSGNFPSGVTQITCTAADTCGLTAQCQFTATVSSGDTIPPQITCPQNVNSEFQCQQANDAITFPAATATDNTGSPNIQYNSGSIQFSLVGNSVRGTFGVGTSTVTATATDSCGLTSNCQFTVSANQVDNTPPTITCASNVNQQLECGTTSTQVNFPATANDNCGPATVTYSSQGATNFFSQSQSSNTMSLGMSTVTATATDTSGRQSSCTMQVTLTEVDNFPPTISCAPNVNQQIDCGTTSTQVNFPATATDNCGAVSVTYSSQGITNFFSQSQSTATMSVGVSTITATATDSNGQTSTCTTQVTITEVDNFPPTITCAQNVNQQIDCGQGSTQVDFRATASDNCGSVTVTYSSQGSTNLFSQSQSTATMNVGFSTITATGTDNAGQSSTCTTQVTITEVDNQPPTLTCASNVNEQIQCGQTSAQVNFPAQATDNCGSAVVTYTSSGSSTFFSQSQSNGVMNVGFSTITATATDNGGRTSTCSMQVTISAVEQNPCETHNCQNGGQCSAFPGSCDQYFCVCPPCFYGRFCENRVDACLNHKCTNGAQCQAQPNSCTDYTCTCPTCFVGPFCQNAIPDPCTNNPCVNNGQCSRLQGSCYAYQCQCQPGYEGVNCEIRTQVYVNPCNNFPCANGGTCTCIANNQYVCTCPDGYGGINCESPIAASPFFESCNNSPCQNNAECYNGYNGNSGSPYRNQYTCVCQQGFGGQNCLTSVSSNPSLDECSVSTCRNGGRCINAYFSFAQTNEPFCECSNGFFGQYCEIRGDDPCLSGPCRNGGFCTSFNSYFTCRCQNQFSGVTCELGGGQGTDAIPPTVTCPPDQQSSASQGQSGVAVTYPDATASDNSGGFVSLSYSRPSGSFFSTGPTTVTVTGTDQSGNQATCQFTVTVSGGTPGQDNIPPQVSCPQNQQTTASQGQNGATINYPPATASDDSGGFVILSYSRPSGSFFSVGTTTVEVQAVDPSGNQASCQFVVTVSTSGPGPDTTRPDLICPENQQATTPQGQSGAAVNYPPATATDNSGGAVQLSYSPPAGSFFNIGTSQVTVRGTDPSGNQAICTFSVTVSAGGGTPGQDTTPPVLTCPGNQQATAMQGQNGVVVNYPPAMATDDSGGFVQLIYSRQSGIFFSTGATTVTVTGIDSSGNMAMCTFTVTVSVGGTQPGPDTTPPVVNCPQNQQATANQGQNGVVVIYPPATATDNSNGIVQLSYSRQSGTFFNTGATTVIVTASDQSGNQDMCTFTVTVSVSTSGDTTPPVVSCPTNQRGTGQNGAIVSYPPATATDNSGGFVDLAYSLPSGFFFSQGSTVVTVTGTDPSGNIGQCTFSVVVTPGGGGVGPQPGGDTIPPFITCPTDQIAYVRSGSTNGAVQFDAATASDNSNAQPTIIYRTGTGATVNPGSLFSVGLTMVTATATDPSGNTADCEFNIAVNVDVQAPWITCPSNEVMNLGVSQSSLVYTYPEASASDNSGGRVDIRYDQPSSATLFRGTTIVTATATDPYGNEASCVYAVTINDFGQNGPFVSGCPGGTDQSQADVTAMLQGTNTVRQVTWPNTPTAGGSNVRTHNMVMSGSTFSAGLTEIVYIFGNSGAESTCTWRVYVLRNNQHACVSNPCMGENTLCFFSEMNYICQGANQAGRRRRDAEEEGPYCGPWCTSLGGFCADRNHNGDRFEPQCFYPGFDTKDSCLSTPCMNNGTCFSSNFESSSSYFCICPPGLEGSRCEHSLHDPSDQRAVDHVPEEDYLYSYWFIYLLLSVVCIVVLLQALIVCQLVAKQMRRVPKTSGIEKQFYE